ncbi:MAG TPA: DUF2252 family protein [Gemmatimonadales bacterium]|nr:DUF2252 family protein [Gemmatimonadales bacterium]
MNIRGSTRRFETWLGRQLRLVPADLRLKHQRMKEDEFFFLRATYYRWAELWAERASKLPAGPSVLSVGDLHIENFGTWRDAEGRLVWGINDFDECDWLPNTQDLVRLASSVLLALQGHRLALKPEDACARLLEGYDACLEAGGRPFVLGESHHALRLMAVERLKEPGKFWEKMNRLRPIHRPCPAGARKALRRQLPDPDLPIEVFHRVAGLGSLGRERYVAIAHWDGARIAREAKALAPPATAWVAGVKSRVAHYRTILEKSIRCADPMVRARRRWIVRRLAPDCSRIELTDLPKRWDEARLLYDMGWETANIHLGTGRPKALRRALAALGSEWLLPAATQMAETVRRDWQEWSGA